MDRNCRSPAVFVLPPLMTCCLASRLNPSLIATRRNSSARALGMHDFGGVAWHGLATLAVLFFDQPENRRKFSQGLLCRWHQGVTPGNCGDFSHPPVRLVPVEDHFVIIEAHSPHSTMNKFSNRTQRGRMPEQT